MEHQFRFNTGGVSCENCTFSTPKHTFFASEDRDRLEEEATHRCHLLLEALALCAGLICLAYLGYHVEPRWLGYWCAYSVGALSSAAAGLLGVALEIHRPKERRSYWAPQTHSTLCDMWYARSATL